MSPNLETSDFFVAGGTLNPETRSYIEREADDQLVRCVLSGKFAHVLTASQLGKSSLMARTAEYLKQKKNCCTATIDLAGFGTHEVSMDQWCFSFISEVVSDWPLSTDLEVWWKEQQSRTTPVKRFSDFLRDVVLSEIDTHIVIFVDEINCTLSLDFSDDFFAAIRFMYNDRAQRPELKRLTFVLLGVASPSDLMKDYMRTPFNISQEVVLRDFGKGEITVLQDGLDEKYPGQGEGILARIYYWTEGHPYLTQKLCKEVVDADEQRWSNQQISEAPPSEAAPSEARSLIDELVNKLFLSNDRKEANLQLAQDYIRNHSQRNELLTIYEKVHKGECVPDDGQDSLKNSLKLLGVVKEDKGSLRVRNRIYKKVFNLDWVQENILPQPLPLPTPTPTPGVKPASSPKDEDTPTRTDRSVRQIIDNVFRKNKRRWYKAIAAVALLVGIASLALSLWFAVISASALWQAPIEVPVPTDTPPTPTIEEIAEETTEEVAEETTDTPPSPAHTPTPVPDLRIGDTERGNNCPLITEIVSLVLEKELGLIVERVERDTLDELLAGLTSREEGEKIDLTFCLWLTEDEEDEDDEPYLSEHVGHIELIGHDFSPHEPNQQRLIMVNASVIVPLKDTCVYDFLEEIKFDHTQFQIDTQTPDAASWIDNNQAKVQSWLPSCASASP